MMETRSGREVRSRTKGEFKEQLRQIFESRFFAEKVLTASQEKESLLKLAQKEDFFEEMHYEELLELHEISHGEMSIAGAIEREDADGEKYSEEIYKIAVQSHFASLENHLPQGYVYVGGAARALLLRSLGIDPLAFPRDIDVASLGETTPEQDLEISEEFMPDDFAHGNGVKKLGSNDEYFTSRDLTINELYASEEEIFFTRTCLFDTIRNIIRPSREELRGWQNRGPSQKMLAKILRFYMENCVKYDKSFLRDVDEYEFEKSFISPFWLALNIDKCFESGDEVAEAYVKELKNAGQLPFDIENATQAAEYVFNLMVESDRDPFYYRHAPVAQFLREEEAVDFEDRGDDFEHLPKQSSMRKQARNR